MSKSASSSASHETTKLVYNAFKICCEGKGITGNLDTCQLEYCIFLSLLRPFDRSIQYKLIIGVYQVEGKKIVFLFLDSVGFQKDYKINIASVIYTCFA